MYPTIGWIPTANRTLWLWWLAPGLYTTLIANGMYHCLLRLSHTSDFVCPCVSPLEPVLAAIMALVGLLVTHPKDAAPIDVNSLAKEKMLLSGLFLTLAMVSPIIMLGVITITLLTPWRSSMLSPCLGRFLGNEHASFILHGYQRFICFLIVIALIGSVCRNFEYWCLAVGHDFGNGDGFTPVILFIPPFISIVFACVVALRKVLIDKFRLKDSAKSIRRRLTVWQDLAYYSFAVAIVSSLILLICAPRSIGEHIANWLMFSARDANMISIAPDRYHEIGRINDDLVIRSRIPERSAYEPKIDRAVGTIDSFDMTLFVNAICSSVLVVTLLPFISRSSAFLSALSRRFGVSACRRSFLEDFLLVLRMPVRKLRMKQAVPGMHNTAVSLLWLLLCYGLLFGMVAFTQGGLGAAICGWIDASLLDAGFKELSTGSHPQLRIFVAALIAMIGAVPLAVTGCAWLPNGRAKHVMLTDDGILLTAGPYLSTLFRPMRCWQDVKSLELCGRSKEIGECKLKIKFFSGGSLTLRTRQLSQSDLAEFITSVDEKAENCSISENVLELQASLRKTSECRLTDEDEFRGISPVNFRSTVFVPYEV
ncbi:MAG: hypothetical protein K2Z81_23995, partial [Cyanobacteria bacterium]|nr:hypothetical protein [Cyanobacteriota bacterium]